MVLHHQYTWQKKEKSLHHASAWKQMENNTYLSLLSLQHLNKAASKIYFSSIVQSHSWPFLLPVFE